MRYKNTILGQMGHVILQPILKKKQKAKVRSSMPWRHPKEMHPAKYKILIIPITVNDNHNFTFFGNRIVFVTFKA